MNRTAGIVVCFLTAVLCLGGCKVNPATGKSQLIMVSAPELEAMGAEASPMLVKEYGGEVGQPQLKQYVTSIGQQLSKHVEPEYADVKWTFTTLDSDVINAFALPGGRVFISRGLIVKLHNEAEIAAVLGHEIGHVTGRHVDERVSRATALELGLQIGGAATQSELAVAAGNLFGQGYLLKFGRDQELEADRLGLRYMMQAGYDPHAMVGVINVLMEASQGSSPPEFLSTHPNPERRMEQVKGLLATPEYQGTAGNPNYKLYEDRFNSNAKPYLKATGAAPKK